MSGVHGQYRPGEVTLASYAHDRDRLYEALIAMGNAGLFSRDLLVPYPVVIAESLLVELDELGRTLAAGLRQVVLHHRRDERIRERLRLAAHVEAALDLADGAPYAVGCFRPDLLVDVEGRVFICEINARFSANAFETSEHINRTLAQHGWLASPLRQVPAMVDVRERLLEPLRGAGPMALVIASHPGDVIHGLLRDEDCVKLRPEELVLQGGQVVARGRRVERFVLELNRDELAQFDRSVLSWMIRHGYCRNDIRTVAIVHDKRMLAVLCDRSIMADYLESSQCDLLARHIPATFLATNREAQAWARARPEDWVLKPNHGGRGEGVLVGRVTPAEQWSACLDSQAEHHTLQRHVEQRRFPILVLDDDRVREVPMMLVGMLPCFDDRGFGPGFWRASTQSVINIFQRRGVLVPCAVLPDVLA